MKPFDNVLVRQAVNYAIDTAHIQKLLAGQAMAADQIYPLGMPGYEAGKHFYSYDPAKAKQLLAQAGYPNGFSTTFYTHNVDPFPKVAQAIQADLKAVGINASIKQMDRATYWNKIEQQKQPHGHGAHRLVHGLPGPQRLDRPALQRGLSGERRLQRELVGGPAA